MVFLAKLIILIFVVHPLRNEEIKIFNKKLKCRKYWKNLVKQSFISEFLLIFLQVSVELMVTGFITLNVPKNNQNNRLIMIIIASSYLVGTILIVPSIIINVLLKKHTVYE